MHKLLLAALCLAPFIAEAEIYKWVDNYGRTHFSDKPVQHAEKQHIHGIIGVKNPSFNLARSVMQLSYQDDNGSMIVQGNVNGVAMQFIVDTGASLVVIPPIIAKQAHINTSHAKTITLQTANGTTQSSLINIASLYAGKLHQKDVKAAVQTISKDPKLGLLGMSFLQAYKMSIDHNRQMITLEAR